MTYEEWIQLIESLKNRRIDKDALLKLQNNTSNVQGRLLPKILELIECRFDLSIKNMMNNLDTMFEDENMLDLMMVNFKKEILFINDILQINIIPSDTKRAYMIKLKSETDKVYDIIERESLESDYTGYLQRLIKNNRIKWSV